MNEQRPVPPIPQGQRPQTQQQSSQGLPKVAPMPIQPVRQNNADLEPLSLVDDIAASSVPARTQGTPGPAPAPGTAASVMGPYASKIKAFSVAQDRAHMTKFTRQTTVTGRGACRLRTFHGRLSDEGLAYLDDKVNEWLDTHPEIEVKFCTTTVGQYDGKIKEPALIVNVWY
jgi:hypothetical protein